MAATTQAPIKVRLETKDKIRYLAAFEDASHAEIADQDSITAPACSAEPIFGSIGWTPLVDLPKSGDLSPGYWMAGW
jgi:hypothetical protein